jgi:hypothetical protein
MGTEDMRNRLLGALAKSSERKVKVEAGDGEKRQARIARERELLLVSGIVPCLKGLCDLAGEDNAEGGAVRDLLEKNYGADILTERGLVLASVRDGTGCVMLNYASRGVVFGALGYSSDWGGRAFQG